MKNYTHKNVGNIKIQNKQFIIGRDKQVNDIIKYFDKVLEGEFATCIISGEAGVGKTYLVSQIAKKLLNVNATYIYGKFKHYNNQMFSAISEAFTQIVEHVLTFPEDRLKHLKKLLESELGDDSSLIIVICPDAEKLLGYHRKNNEEDYHKLEYRFQEAIRTFLDILAQELYPLIVHIDDLQWADEKSLRMLDILCYKPNNMNFYMVLSLRDGIDNNQVKMKQLKMFGKYVKNTLNINLLRLNLEQTEEFLKYLFDNKVYDIKNIAKAIFKATLGTPFYIKQLIDTIFKQEKVYFDKKLNMWRFKFTFLQKLQLPEDIKHILINHINQLSLHDKQLLELLSCVGGQVDEKLLGKIITIKSEKAFGELEKLCNKGLLIKDVNEYHTKYFFTHDIIFELVYSSISNKIKAQNHYNIVNKLINDLDKEYIDEHRIFIALQLLKCKELILKEEDSSKYVVELYYAGVKAKKTTLVKEALEFFELCILLF